MIFVEIERNLQVSDIHHYSVRALLTAVPSVSYQVVLPIFPCALRIHIICCTGTPAAWYPFLGHKWFVKDSDMGITWGVVTTPSIMDLLRVLTGQDVEEEIRCPCNLIGATGECAAMQCQKLEDPLPLLQLIFLNRNDDIRVWFLANNGHDLLELMVLKSRRQDGEDLDEPTTPPNGRYPFFDREVWDASAGGEGSVGAIVEEVSGETRNG